MEKIGALWLKDGKQGKFMSGIIGGKQVMVFRNARKQEGSKQPDYEVFNPGQKGEPPPKDENAQDDVPF